MKDTQAVDLLQQGSLQGMEALINTYYLPALRTAYLVVQEKNLAEDVVQNAFLSLPETIHRFDPDRPFEPWFLRCVVNAAINLNRREQRLSLLDSPDSDKTFSAENWLIEQNPGPEEQYEQSEQREIIQQALAQLPLRQRAAIVMRYYLEMSEKEMSDALDCPKSSLKWWLHAAKRRLRDLLQVFAPAESGKE